MEVPHMGGFNRDGRAYEVSAVSAVQDLTKPDILELSGIKGKTTTKDDVTIRLSAVSGLYATKSQLLTLTHDIDITTSDGKHAELSEAQIETAKGNIVSTKPVKVEFPNGNLRGNRLEIVDNGERVHFSGGVILNTSGRAPAGQTQPAQISKVGLPAQHDAPVRVQSASLEIRDKDHLATFVGDVSAVQGDSTLTCDTLAVDYNGGMTDLAAGSELGQQIRHMDGKGHVILTQNDQIATGDNVSFDAQSNTATLTDNVSVTQAQNVVRGDKVIVDLTTGQARVEMHHNNNQGRVQSVFYPHAEDGTVVGPKARSPKSAPAAPLALHAH